MRTYILALSCFCFVLLMANVARAHCEIPCGIYGDNTRFVILEEHLTTIEKSMTKIIELSKKGGNKNQLVRWVQNKEQHADEFGHIVTQYFLRQRIKPSKTPGKPDLSREKYLKQLVLLHELYVYSMKAKQTTELKHVRTMRSVLRRFKLLYH